MLDFVCVNRIVSIYTQISREDPHSIGIRHQCTASVSRRGVYNINLNSFYNTIKAAVACNAWKSRQWDFDAKDFQHLAHYLFKKAINNSSPRSAMKSVITQFARQRVTEHLLFASAAAGALPEPPRLGCTFERYCLSTYQNRRQLSHRCFFAAATDRRVFLICGSDIANTPSKQVDLIREKEIEGESFVALSFGPKMRRG